MKQRHHLNIMAALWCAVMSMPAAAGLGSLHVQSALGEPFSGSIVVSGNEAKMLLNRDSKPIITGLPLRATVAQQGDNALVRLRSSQPIREPLLSFSLSVGNQSRQYSAMIDPSDYRSAAPAKVQSHSEALNAPAPTKNIAVPPADADARRETARTAVAAALAQEDAAPKTPVHPSAVPVAGQRYTTKTQERLVDVARQLRPRGLTLNQTIRALVKANPHAFRQGNPRLMHSGVSLQIPTMAQMRRLAAEERPTTPIQTQAPATPAAPGTTAAATIPASAIDTPTQPSVTAPTTTPTPPIPAAEAEGEMAAEVGTASTVAASPPVTTAEATAALPVSTPLTTPTPPVSQSAADGGIWGYLLGAAGLLLLAWLWWRRRQPDTLPLQTGTTTADTTEIDRSYIVSPAQIVEDDVDDDVVFVDVDDNTQAAEPHQDDVIDVDVVEVDVVEVAVAAAQPQTPPPVTDTGWRWQTDTPSAAHEPTSVNTATDNAAADDFVAFDWDAPAPDAPLSEDNSTNVYKGTEPTSEGQQRQAFAASGDDLAAVDIDWETLGLSTEETPAQPAAAAASDEALADKAAPPLNLTVPMEAKLELAKMYLEIDDAQTARKTLRELIAEADGDILTEALALIQQLGD